MIVAVIVMVVVQVISDDIVGVISVLDRLVAAAFFMDVIDIMQAAGVSDGAARGVLLAHRDAARLVLVSVIVIMPAALAVLVAFVSVVVIVLLVRVAVGVIFVCMSVRVLLAVVVLAVVLLVVVIVVVIMAGVVLMIVIVFIVAHR